jgi:hypothetical protein
MHLQGIMFLQQTHLLVEDAGLLAVQATGYTQ